MTTLKEELKTNLDFANIQHEVFLSLMVTVDRMSRRHSDFMSEFGISQKQYNILRILRGAGEQGIPVMEIGRRMIEKSPDVSRIIDRLIDLGFVKRRRQRKDRRVVIVTISDKGLALLSKMDDPVQKEVIDTLRHVEESDLHNLKDLLEKVRDSIYRSDQ